MTSFEEGCIDRVQAILEQLGLASIERKSSHQLRVTIQAAPGVRYRVFFRGVSTRVEIEAVVFKSVAGLDRSVNVFLETLLQYNGTVRPFGFATVSAATGRQLVLRYSPLCQSLSARELKSLIECLNETFINHVPHLHELAIEADLNFTGHSEIDFISIIRGIIND